jgi:hypothetical protein
MDWSLIIPPGYLKPHQLDQLNSCYERVISRERRKLMKEYGYVVAHRRYPLDDSWVAVLCDAARAGRQRREEYYDRLFGLRRTRPKPRATLRDKLAHVTAANGYAPAEVEHAQRRLRKLTA